jgi:hypothetical protein
MSTLYLYNAHIPNPIDTTHYRFEPVDDFENRYREFEEENRHTRNINFRSTKVFEKAGQISVQSHFYPSQPKLWDYCAVLGLFQSRHIFPYEDKEGGSELFARVGGRTYDWSLLRVKEVEMYLESTIKKLDSFSDKERHLFFKSLGLLFEAELFTPYSDLKDVWYLQPIELFCRGLYCLDNNVQNPKKVPGDPHYIDYLKYAVEKFNFESQYSNTKTIESFLTDIKDVRNWVMHGKVWECKVFSNRAEEVTFYHRIEALIKALLLSYVGINSFDNRDALIHGIILGNAVVPVWVKD